MTTIVLCGQKNDRALSLVLIKALKKHGEIQYYNGNLLKSWGEKLCSGFCVLDCERLPKMELQSGILIFKNSFEPEQIRELPSGIFPVFSAQNSAAAKALTGTGINAIVCGTSPKDTLSIASITETDATISLQRSIKNMLGEVLEPRDIPIHMEKSASPYSLLATCAVFLLSGLSPNEEFYF